MKTSLDYLPDSKQRDIQRIATILLDEFEQATQLTTGKKRLNRILMIILFGSYARDTWVEDDTSGYVSDYDILVVLNRKDLVEEYTIWNAAEDRITRKITQPINLIVHSLGEVNDQLAQGQYFFKDVREDGVLVYTTGKHELARPGNLMPVEARAIAEKHFEQWYESANGFLIAYNAVLNAGDLKNSAFQPALVAFLLHQATERFFVTILLVYTNYKPRTHNLKHLNNMAIQQDKRLLDVFPQDTKFRRRCFELLKRAYIEARYSEHYKITQEELAYLEERVRYLQQQTEALCQEKIARFAP